MIPLNAVGRLAAEVTYNHVRGWLEGVARRMARARGQDREEWTLRARDVFLDAFLEYDPKRGPFRPFLSARLRHRLIDLYRRDKRFHALIEVRDPHDLYAAADRRPAPAADAVRAVEAGLAAVRRRPSRGVGPKVVAALRRAVAARLAALGWSDDRVLDAMDAAAALFARRR